MKGDCVNFVRTLKRNIIYFSEICFAFEQLIDEREISRVHAVTRLVAQGPYHRTEAEATKCH
jgi:hypothetical protein